jgi:hypothetical protein
MSASDPYKDIVPPFGFIHVCQPRPVALSMLTARNHLHFGPLPLPSSRKSCSPVCEPKSRKWSIISRIPITMTMVKLDLEAFLSFIEITPTTPTTWRKHLESGTKRVPSHHPSPQIEADGPQSLANPGLLFAQLEKRDTRRDDGKGPTTLAQCDTPLELAGEKESVVVDTQIQLYATNAQLCHPWVSPVTGYLGGLPPLFICAGDNEVLRDEITYM